VDYDRKIAEEENESIEDELRADAL
jgi:hypothetical protein